MTAINFNEDILKKNAQLQDEVPLKGLLTGYGFNGQAKILCYAGHYMSDTQTLYLSEPISKQQHGIIVVFQGFDPTNGQTRNYRFQHFFVPKKHVEDHPGKGICFPIMSDHIFCVKYLYVSDESIAGNTRNNDANFTMSAGPVQANRYWVLSYVIGV